MGNIMLLPFLATEVAFKWLTPEDEPATVA